MKTAACILMILWIALLIEPASANFSIENPYSSCAKKQEEKTSCSKSSCGEPVESGDENDCEDNRCNPIMSCPTGNFYFFNPFNLILADLQVSKEKKALINDNRISESLSECWHPPEII